MFYTLISNSGLMRPKLDFFNLLALSKPRKVQEYDMPLEFSTAK